MDIISKLRGRKRENGKREPTFDVNMIEHRKIPLRLPKGAQITEHIFQNPDVTSSVAAVSCKLYDGRMQLELYSRAGRFEKTSERMEAEGVVCQNVNTVRDYSIGSFPDNAPIHNESHRLIAFADGVTLSEHSKPDAAALKTLATCFDKLESTQLLSGNSGIREAMVRKIYETIPLLEATVERATPSSKARG